ncbi:hypothetical protein [Teichococcus aestuarii]
MPRLTLKGLGKAYGPLKVVNDVDLTLEEGSSSPSSAPRAAARRRRCA